MKQNKENELGNLVKRYYGLPKGFLILRPDANVHINPGISISRRALKHTIEERKIDGYSLKKIKIMFNLIPEVLKKPELHILNTNQKYPGSFISGSLFSGNLEALLVIHIPEYARQRVINAYYRPNSKFSKMKQKLLRVHDTNLPPEGRNVHVK